MVAPWVAPAVLTGASAVGSIFSKSKKQKIPSQVTDSWDALLNFGRTGKIGDYTAGEAYGGDLGNYDKSAIENAGQSKLLAMLQSGRPDLFNAGSGELNKLLTTDFYDPYSEKGLFKGFAQNIDRETRDSTNALKRNAAFGGNLYSRDTFRRMGDLQEQGLNQKSNKLAELYDTFAQRRLSAVPLAFQGAQIGEGIDQGRIDSAFRYGGLDRNLADAQAKAKYADYLRGRGEMTARLDAYRSVAGGYPQQQYNPSPYEGVLNMLGTIGGYGLSNYFNKSGGGGAGASGSGYLPPELSLIDPGVRSSYYRTLGN